MSDYSAGAYLQAVLPLNIHRGFTSASMSQADAATETQENRHTNSVIIEFHPAVPKASPHQKSCHLYWVRNGKLNHCLRCQDTRSFPEGLLARKRIRRWQ